MARASNAEFAHGELWGLLKALSLVAAHIIAARTAMPKQVGALAFGSIRFIAVGLCVWSQDMQFVLASANVVAAIHRGIMQFVQGAHVNLWRIGWHACDVIG